MNDNTPRSIIPSQNNALEELTFRVKLIWRLMADRRVSPYVKLLPIGALIYLISPIDAIMGIPGISALDDMGILWLGSYFFIELCPTNIIEEHVRELTHNHTVVEEGSQGQPPAEVIDGEVTDVQE
ncbi:MAG: YkvA family protein [Anaerolineales bacterium]|nr:YkvA family protein [Anaerolineales bacterium]